MIDHCLPTLKLGDRSGQLIQPIYLVDSNLLLYCSLQNTENFSTLSGATGFNTQNFSTLIDFT